MYQINWHFSINTASDMTIEKLQKVAMSAQVQGQVATLVEFLCKCPNQQVLFESPVKSAMLEAWLCKASFWAHVQ